MRINFKLKLTNQFWIVTYKLLHDALFLVLVLFLGILVMEGMLPGIISDHIGLYKIIFLIAAQISAISTIQKNYGENWPRAPRALGKKIWIMLVLILFLLAINSLLRLNSFLIPLFIFFIAASTYFSYKVIFEEARRKN